MDLHVSDIIATLALVIAIFSLWSQSKDRHQQVIISNISEYISEYTSRYQEIFEKLPKVVLEEDFDLSSLPEHEQDKLLRYVWLYFDLCLEQYNLYHELNLINRPLWLLWKSSMTTAFSRPALQQCWKIIIEKSSYPTNFLKFVDGKMSA